MKFQLLVLLTTVSIGINSCQGQKAEEEVLLAPKAFQAKIADVKGRLLDVRTPDEYKSGHLEGSENINFFDEDFQERIKALPKDETYFVYCRSGGRSGKACAMMEEAGFKNVYDMAGGILAWEKEALPLQKDE